MKYIYSLLFVVVVFSCKKEVKPVEEKEVERELKSGMYRAVIDVQDNKQLPFLFEVKSDKSIVVYNAEEQIQVSDVSVANSMVHITMPVFDAHLKGRIDDKGNIEGTYEKGPNYTPVPFEAIHDIHFRYPVMAKTHQPVGGNWEVTFSPGTDNEYKAKGVFKDGDENVVTGTFLTETGDYRFLEGALDGNKLKFSAFDGAHAFYFDGEVKGDSIVNGMFYSGNHYKEPWVAIKNSTFELTDPSKLTYLKEGYDKIEFAFPDINGNQVSLKDERFKDKAVIVQIMGSWCPNCLDESKYLSNYYKTKPEGVEFVALAFENAKEDKAVKNLKRLKERLEIPYPILLAQTGTASKKKAAEKLPMLNHVLSYPTTIFIDKKGQVQKVHTGFNGPATRQKFLDFKKEFESLVKELGK
ncbi:peroxiredoxin family protein [Pseudofulvibacter geojedonensis]|uniref:Peroxiredoxin family protein n=1 Tax=Pseudofulvibacter geojedonensis TaxID=1123758 RepID=A0ABW3HYF4_9FLAO